MARQTCTRADSADAKPTLARLPRKQMGVVYHTDTYNTIVAAIDEPTPLPSAATMLRDLLDIYRT